MYVYNDWITFKLNIRHEATYFARTLKDMQYVYTILFLPLTAVPALASLPWSTTMIVRRNVRQLWSRFHSVYGRAAPGSLQLRKVSRSTQRLAPFEKLVNGFCEQSNHVSSTIKYLLCFSEIRNASFGLFSIQCTFQRHNMLKQDTRQILNIIFEKGLNIGI